MTRGAGSPPETEGRIVLRKHLMRGTTAGAVKG